MHSHWGPVARWAVLNVLAGGLASCAGIDYATVPTRLVPLDDPDKAAEARAANLQADLNAGLDGIRYYDRSCYLIVYPDGAGGVLWQLQEMDDPTKLRIVKPYNVFAGLTATLSFADGGLTSTRESARATEVPQAVLGAILDIIPGALGTLGFKEDLPEGDTKPAFPLTKPPTPHAVRGFCCYKLVSDAETGQLRFVGEPLMDPIYVSVSPATTSR